MQEVWRKIETELANLAPDLLTRLHPGVAEEAFTRVESRLGFTLPEEIKAFFRLQNGSMGPFFGSWELLSLDEMCNDWMMMRARPPLFRAASSLLILNPLSLCWDEPGFLLLYTKKGRNTFPVVADDLNQFLEELVRSLKMGCYVYDEKAKRLCMVNAGVPFP